MSFSVPLSLARLIQQPCFEQYAIVEKFNKDTGNNGVKKKNSLTDLEELVGGCLAVGGV